MTNDEMLRPCTLWGHKFDACDFNMDYFEVFRNESDCNYNVCFLGTKIATVDEYADSFPIYRQAITTIADALNAPVLATEEVLAGLPKDAKVWCVLKDEQYRCFYLNDEWIVKIPTKPFEVDIVYEYEKVTRCNRIMADKDDPKTADYLRQFTLDGVRKETNND